ncbi:hypothetical protein MIMGU_mgv1a024348mg [Erythranthe guttata]|uniref:Transmembrane protein n=1 Tax=Erythranthe guttata TaxID=4155 RepID=A0A022R6F7_ERYGU|nr:PREDICTED: uncharacterized protein At5g23160 [Erythranthe guttata]EYU35579.1 hypothetical protein MIMGU_mgv1a024348mg [Erythranthe guttata]|eukprot:XP_012839593.1 PREDICTED: uncharacterized protein At5g23160 [Erythranthe guttata]
MAANRRSRKGRRMSSKEFILSFFTFFFNSCFGCSQQPPLEAEVEEELNSSTDKNTNAAEKSSASVKYISRSTAPVPIINQSAPPHAVGSIKRRVNDKKDFEIRIGGGGGGDEIHSMVGALIVSVTLVVMLIWGKLCAVICAALWLYFVPRFRAEYRNGFYEFDRRKIVSKNAEIIDSPEDKRRVVFEGFLERNHRVRI